MEHNRLSYLDNLRFSLVALVISHHANAAYGAVGGWSYTVREPATFVTEILCDMYAGITQAFFMSSFFMVSAFFTAATFDRKGAFRYGSRRLVRLGIPILVYFYVLSVLLSFFIHQFQGHAQYTLHDFFFLERFHRFRGFGPLWFAFTLLIFESFYAAWRIPTEWFGRKPRAYSLPKDWQVLLFIVLIGLFTFLVRQWFTLYVFVWHLRLAYFPLYISFFTFGLMAYRSGWFTQLSAKQANRWFSVALFAVALMPVVMLFNRAMGSDEQAFFGGFNWQSFAYSVWEPFVCVGINMKLIVWYRERFNFSNALTKRMAASSYTAYIFHAFFIVFATYLFTFFSLGRLPEILLMWPVAIISCFLFADVVRRIPLFNRIL